MKYGRYFQQRLVRSYLMFMLVMVLFSTIYWAIQLQAEQHHALQEQLALMVRQGNSQLDDAFMRVKPVLYMHLQDPLIQKVLAQEGNTSPSDTLNLYYLAQGALRQNPGLLAIHFVSPGGRIYSSQLYPDQKEIAAAVELARGRHGLLQIGEPFYGVIERHKEYILPLCKELISLHTGQVIGYIVVYMDLSRIFAGVDAELANGYHTLILADDGQQLYRSNTNQELLEQREGTQLLEQLNQIGEGRDVAYVYQDGTTCLYGQRNATTGWNLFKFCSKAKAGSALQPRILFFMLISGLLYLVVALVANGVSKRQTYNVSLLRHAFENTGNASLPLIPDDLVQRDEVGELIHSYNRMVDQLHRSIEKEYSATIRAQEMQIRMLSYQINPHFLYNCLNLISSLAIIKSAPEIARISHILGEMFHYSIDSSDVVTIRKEMNHILDYLEIQQVRFPGQFTVDYDLQTDLLDTPCMKFILQPIVENSFLHGFLPFLPGRENRMTLSVYRQGEDILFTVLDNGHGIAPDVLFQLRRKLEQTGTRPPEGSIGLWNIHQRIVAYYGPAYGMTIESQPECYTRVTLRYPLRLDENR